MRGNRQEAVPPDGTGQETTSLKTKLHDNNNDKSTIKQWIKAGIGILFYKNLISFSTACRLSDFLEVRNG